MRQFNNKSCVIHRDLFLMEVSFANLSYTGHRHQSPSPQCRRINSPETSRATSVRINPQAATLRKREVLSEYEESQDDLIGRWFDKNLANPKQKLGSLISLPVYLPNKI